MNEDEAKRDLVRRWLVKAWHDLAAAGKLAGGPDVYLDVAIYHCHQAAEKALKAFLVFHDQRFQTWIYWICLYRFHRTGARPAATLEVDPQAKRYAGCERRWP